MKNYYYSDIFTVRFSETDMAGIAHFSSILKWVENTEVEFFQRNKILFAEKKETHLIGYPRIDIKVQFLKPAKYDDKIRVGLTLVKKLEEEDKCFAWEFIVQKIDLNGGFITLSKGHVQTIFAEINYRTGEIIQTLPIVESIRKLLNSQFFL